MNGFRRLSLQAVAVLVLAVVALSWANALMASLSTYRSPFHGHTVAPGEAIGTPLTHRLVFVYVDGLRVDTAADAKVMPYLNELRAHGAAAISHSRQPSYSVPGYTTMMSGAWPEFNDGPLLNPDEDHLTFWPQDQIFAAAKRAGLKVGLADHYSAEKLIPQDALADHSYVHGEDDVDDRAVAEAAIRWLKDGSFQFIVVHFDQVDDTGHRFGPRSPLWNAAAGRVDVLLRELGNALDLSRDTIFITSDHGHIDQGGHGGHEDVVTHEPWILAGAGVKPGKYPDTEMVDLAPTMAALLGTSIPALNQGHVVVEMLQLPDGPATSPTSTQQAAAGPREEHFPQVLAALEKQQKQWVSAYTAATGQRISPVAGGSSIVDWYQGGVAERRRIQEGFERLPRIAVAFAALLAIAIAFWLGRGRLLMWQVGGALIYLALFHVSYCFAEGRTYSLSSVLSANDIMLAGILTAGFAFVVACAIYLWRSSALRQGAIAAANAALGAGLVTIAIVAIPALVGYVINGAVITWVLPDFAWMFFTFLSLLQIAGIGASAIVLAVVSAVGARFLAPSAA